MTEKPPPASETKRRGRLPRFTIATLFIFTFFVAVLSAAIHYALGDAVSQSEAEFQRRMALLVILAPPLMIVTMAAVVFGIRWHHKWQQSRKK